MSGSPRGLRRISPASTVGVIGAGTFGTAVAIRLAAAKTRTTLVARACADVERLRAAGENARYLPGLPFPPSLQIACVDDAPWSRFDLIFVGVPSQSLHSLLEDRPALREDAVVVSLAKGLARPDGKTPVTLLGESYGLDRVAYVGGPAHAGELARTGARMVAASSNGTVAQDVAAIFRHAGVSCAPSTDPVGVELAGVAKNVAALAVGATQPHGLNAAGATAGAVFAEVWLLGEQLGARAESFIGAAGTGDLVATALASGSRNRQAGALLDDGVPADEIPVRLGQAVEALGTVPLLIAALAREGVHAPTIEALGRMVAGVGDSAGLLQHAFPA